MRMRVRTRESEREKGRVFKSEREKEREKQIDLLFLIEALWMTIFGGNPYSRRLYIFMYTLRIIEL